MDRIGPRVRRTLLVPRPWTGSVEHYYHFLLGYLYPVVMWVHAHPDVPVALRSCGPLSSWFEVLPTRCDWKLQNVELFRSRVRAGMDEVVELAPLDTPSSFHPVFLRAFADLVLDRWGIRPLGRSVSITVLERGPSLPYYRMAGTANPGSGADRRSVPNLDEIAHALARSGPVTAADTALLDPRDQVASLARTTVLVGQHGAGLANMLWMPQGGCVIEIQPPVHDSAGRIYREMARALGHAYTRIPQDHSHSPVSAERVASAVGKLRARVR